VHLELCTYFQDELKWTICRRFNRSSQESKLSEAGNDDERLADALKDVHFSAKARLTHLSRVYSASVEVQLDEDSAFLVCTNRRSRLAGRDGKPVPPGQALLTFARLYDAAEQPERLVEFANIYGTLRICEHLLAREAAWPGWTENRDCGKGCNAYSWRERVDDWMYFAKEAHAMMSIQLALHDKEGKRLTLEALRDLGIIDRLPPSNDDAALQSAKDLEGDNLKQESYRRLTKRAESWIDAVPLHGGLAVRLLPHPKLGYEAGVAVTALHGILALDLAGMIGSQVEFTACVDCGVTLDWQHGKKAIRCDECRKEKRRLDRSMYNYRQNPDQKRPRKYL
jgi:hypothetical protein